MRTSLLKWHTKPEVEVNLHLIILEMLEIGCDWFWHRTMPVHFVDLSHILADDKFSEPGVKVHHGCFRVLGISFGNYHDNQSCCERKTVMQCN